MTPNANDPQVFQCAQQHLPILDLPVEIQTLIFSYLPASDQVCLGLTYKTMILVLATVNLNLTKNIWLKMEKWNLMKKLESWMPRLKYLFCRLCLKYRSIHRDLWKVMGPSFYAQGEKWCGTSLRSHPFDRTICPECMVWK